MGLLILDEQFIGQAIEAVRQAKKEICICSFKIEITEKPAGKKLKEFFEALSNRAADGVKIRILFNWRANEKSVPRTNKPTAIILKNQKMDLRYLTQDRCCHAKILIIDRARAIIGSHNLSVRSISSNFEVSYLLPDPESVAELQSIFDTIFSTAKPI